MTPKPRFPRLLTASEVAQLFGVDAKTVTRWENSGKLPASIRTLGGHRRWHESDIRARINATATDPQLEDVDDIPPASRIRPLDTPWWDQDQ